MVVNDAMDTMDKDNLQWPMTLSGHGNHTTSPSCCRDRMRFYAAMSNEQRKMEMIDETCSQTERSSPSEHDDAQDGGIAHGLTRNQWGEGMSL
jgi:hypothetical protein